MRPPFGPAIPRIASRLPPDTVVDIRRPRGPVAISVLMPVYRQEPFVAAAVRSILEQEEVIADVVISDDASGDATLQHALDAVRAAGRGHPHGVRVRRGTSRQYRWHLHTLIAAAASPLIVQAHGDDISAPGRLATILAAFREHGAAMVATGMRTINEAGEPRHYIGPEGEPGAMRAVEADEALDRPPWAIGAVEAWDREAFGAFAALTPEFAPTSHDRIMLLRGALLGRAVAVAGPWVDRREYPGAWGQQMVDTRDGSTRAHGWALTAILALDVFRLDISAAREAGLIDAPRAAELHARLAERVAVEVAQLRRHTGEQLEAGRRLRWVDVDD